jgi:hypothetical protein
MSVVANISEVHRYALPMFRAENRKHCCQQHHNTEYKILIESETISFAGMQNNVSNLPFCNPADHYMQSSLPTASVQPTVARYADKEYVDCMVFRHPRNTEACTLVI